MHDYSNLHRILLEALVIVALGVVIGLSANLGLIHKVLLGEPPGDVQQSEAQVATQTETAYPQPVDLASVQHLTDTGQALLIDARIKELFSEGHLPKARPLPLDEIDRLLTTFQQDVPLETTLIVYCNGYGCPDSFDLALLLINAGYRDVRVFEGGVPEWQDAGLPIIQGRTP